MKVSINSSYRLIKLFCIIFIVLSFSPKHVSADMSCSGSQVFGEFRDFPGPVPDWERNVGITNGPVYFHISARKLESDTIIQTYLFDGYSWVKRDPPYTGLLGTTLRFTEAKDFTLGGGWVYINAAGETKSIICSSNVRILETRTEANYGSSRLSYNGIPDSRVIQINRSDYIGLIRGSGTWGGYNGGASPINQWTWKTNDRIDYGWGDKGYWGPAHDGWYSPKCPTELSKQATITFSTPTYSPGEGLGAYMDYDLTKLIIYSRSLPGDCPSNPPPIERTVYGYIQDETTRSGVGGALIRINKKLSSGDSSVFAGSTTSRSGDGYWKVDLSDTSLYEIQSIETNNGVLCTGDGSDPSFPADPPGATKISVNQVNWINPPTNAGPIIFYDWCPNLPTPTPLPPGSHCRSYELGSGHDGLTNVYDKYTTFTVPQNNSIIDEIGVKAGVYGGANDRRITCKVTNNSGQDISVAKSSLQMRDGDGVEGWHTINFSDNPFTLQANTDYRLYCKGPESWPSIFWVWGGQYGDNTKDYWVDHCTVPPTPTPTPVPKAWFQVSNLDVYSNGNITSEVPTTASDPYLINDTLGGIAFSGGSLSLGVAADHISPNSNWQIENYPVSISAYSFKNVWSWAGLTVTNDIPHHYCPTSYDASCNAAIANKTLSELPSGVYFTTETLDIDTDQAITGGKKILIIVGTSTSSPKDLNINKPITVDATSTLGIIVTNDIQIDKTVNEVDGVYYAFKDIHTGVSDAGSRVQLTVNGNLMAPSGKIYLERDLGDDTNLTTPAEIINPDAKYFIAFSSLLSKKKVTWKEINP